MSLDAPFLSAFDRNQATKVAENKTNKNKEELKMKEGNTTAMLEQLRLREVALNSIFAKTGQKIRVKAVKVHKNNNERVGLEVRDKELPIVLTYYPTADDMMQPDVRHAHQLGSSRADVPGSPLLANQGRLGNLHPPGLLKATNCITHRESLPTLHPGRLSLFPCPPRPHPGPHPSRTGG